MRVCKANFPEEPTCAYQISNLDSGSLVALWSLAGLFKPQFFHL